MPNLCIDLSRWSCNASTVYDGDILKWLLRHALYSSVETVVHPLSHSAFNDYPQILFRLHWHHKINIGNVWGSGTGYIMGLAGRCHPAGLTLGPSKARHTGFLAQEQGEMMWNSLSRETAEFLLKQELGHVFHLDFGGVARRRIRIYETCPGFVYPSISTRHRSCSFPALRRHSFIHKTGAWDPKRSMRSVEYFRMVVARNWRRRRPHILRQPYFSPTATPAEHAHHHPTAQIAAHLGQNAEHLGHRSQSNTMRTVMGRMHIIVHWLKVWGTL
ncbi:uncharacterized protein LACBIDRAFT_329310 [Laccaria bicolor S238N-H82]|uniref:Predicted protein n=1 Tax=Laccaria bicolor (strain S238N-H82 / ATCC MYA-4686) TaxID=486041 RepID=B0DHM6_LACBS|nr:uncharacterized protein LACBIDRAFT_329310 [Laccaria bicolor S238N-H82]EDR05757.1 predicted protein [Laccaria bicolor S238N-H82]|eukprot:XP_001883433.1 predicted protein [Laccaria bicolor S238N-H82]